MNPNQKEQIKKLQIEEIHDLLTQPQTKRVVTFHELYAIQWYLIEKMNIHEFLLFLTGKIWQYRKNLIEKYRGVP